MTVVGKKSIEYCLEPFQGVLITDWCVSVTDYGADNGERGSGGEGRHQSYGTASPTDRRDDRRRKKPTVQDVFNQDDDAADAPKKRKLGTSLRLCVDVFK